MCLIVKEDCKIEIAKVDVTTYKYIDDYNDDYWCGIYFSTPKFSYNQIQQAKNKDYSLFKNIEHLQIYNGMINEGFHSFINEYHYSRSKGSICIIPKGSEYCLGINDDIVSNQIIVFKTEEDYDRYIASKVSSN